MSFDRNWDETLLAHSYEKVDDSNDSMALQDLARRAYISVSGNCYGRVDIRKRDVSGISKILKIREILCFGGECKLWSGKRNII